MTPSECIFLFPRLSTSLYDTSAVANAALLTFSLSYTIFSLFYFFVRVMLSLSLSLTFSSINDYYRNVCSVYHTRNLSEIRLIFVANSTLRTKLRACTIVQTRFVSIYFVYHSWLMLMLIPMR